MYEKALTINSELGRQEGKANLYGNLDNVHWIRGELDQARVSWQRVVLLSQEIDSPTALQVQVWIDELDAE